MDIFFNFILYTDYILPLIPIIFGIFKFRHLNIIAKVVILLLLTAFIFNSAYLYYYKNGINTNIIAKIFNSFEFISILFIFYKQYITYFNKKIIRLISIISIIPFIYLLLFVIDNNPVGFDTSIYMNLLFTILGFSIIIIHRVKNNYIHISTYYFNLAIFFYFSASSIIYVFSNYIISSEKILFGNIWIINNFINILTTILFSIGIWTLYKKTA